MASSALKYVGATKPTNSATYVAPKDTTKYVQPEYTSKYGDQISATLDKVTNRQSFSYDPLKDASYQALSKVYTKRGEKAAKSTMADAAALNGGLGSSYAVSAAQQTRNDYNAELAALIPDLEANAYQRYADNFNMNVSALGALQDAEASEYGKFRDTVGDAQWKYGVDYDKYRDSVADAQWKYGQDYQKYRDAMGDYQWGKNFNLDVYSLKKAKSGGGGGRRSSGGGGGRYSSAGSGPIIGYNDGKVPVDPIKQAIKTVKKTAKKATKKTTGKKSKTTTKKGGKK